MASWAAVEDVWRDIEILSHMNKEAPHREVFDSSAMHDQGISIQRNDCLPKGMSKYNAILKTAPEYPCIGRGRAAISKAAKAAIDAEYDPAREIYEHLRQTNPISYSNENIENHFGFKPLPLTVEPYQFDDAMSRNALLNGLAKKREKQLCANSPKKREKEISVEKKPVPVEEFKLKQQYVLEKPVPVKEFKPKQQYVLESKLDFPALR